MDDTGATELFESLINVFKLVDCMAEVTISFVASTIGESNSISLKNLLLNHYIANLPTNQKAIVECKKTQFKDWLSEKLTLHITKFLTSGKLNQLQNDNKVLNTPGLTLDKKITNIGHVAYQVCPQLRYGSPSLPVRMRRNTYSVEVFQYTANSQTVQFAAAAKSFNENYSCRQSHDCKLISLQRCRKSSYSSSQNYKCNCSTSTVVLHFKHIHTDCTQITINNKSHVKVLIKGNVVRAFGEHFVAKT
jgi:hypothetical protein